MNRLGSALRWRRVAHRDDVTRGTQRGSDVENEEGSKRPGHEYWSARPGNRHGAHPGRLSKKLTHRAERRAVKVAESARQK